MVKRLARTLTWRFLHCEQPALDFLCARRGMMEYLTLGTDHCSASANTSANNVHLIPKFGQYGIPRSKRF